MTEVNYLESLNPLQYESVCSTEGPNLIIAIIRFGPSVLQTDSYCSGLRLSR